MIRLATLGDATAIAEVHVQSWQVIYRGHFPDEMLDKLSVETRSARWAEIISSQPNNVAVYEASSGITGFVSLGSSRDDDAKSDVGEVTAIYIHPQSWRQGIGNILMAWAKEAARSRDWRKMTLWVLRENSQARAFYERHGWITDGRTKADNFGDIEVVEIRYEWACAI